jgi:hypothetical protein
MTPFTDSLQVVSLIKIKGMKMFLALYRMILGIAASVDLNMAIGLN